MMPPLKLDEVTAEAILTAWANLQDGMLTEPGVLKRRLVDHWPEIFNDPIGADLAGDSGRWIWGMREHLRAAWQDKKTGLWFVFKLRDLYGRRVRERQQKQFAAVSAEAVVSRAIESFAERGRQFGFVVDPPPPASTFDDLMTYFQRSLRNAVICKRKDKDCPAPYFFKDEGARTQAYCSDECRDRARNESKLFWWNDSPNSPKKERQQKRDKKSKARQKARKLR